MLLFLCVCGCGGTSGPNVQFVEGVVRFENQPLSNVLVVFHPKGEGIAASGFTNDNGVFYLTALQGGARNAGTPLGEYTVTFARNKDEPTTYVEVKEAGGTERVPIYDSLIPVRYNDPKTSDVTATVGKKKNRYEFTLESQ